MKKLYSISLLFLSLLASAQNYQAVYSNTESFYYNSNAQRIYGIKPDSFSVSSGDTIFYHYLTVLDTNTDSQWFPGCADLMFDYPTWQGEKTIIKSNGTMIFFNVAQDSIFVSSNTIPSQNWLMYTFPNGDKIMASHTSTVFESIGPFTDSVKTFTLNVTDASGNPVTDPLNGKEIKLSKNKGWFVSFNWRDFPADTNRWTIEPAMRLTHRELNKLYPGDVVYVQITYSNGPADNWYDTYLTRQDYGSDSIVFTIARQLSTPVATGSWPPYTWNTTYDTIHKVVLNPDSFIFSGMPEQINNTGDLTQVEGYYMTRYTSGSCIKYKYDPRYRGLYYYDTDSSCYAYTMEPIYAGTMYVSGTGSGYNYANYQTQGGPYSYHDVTLYSDSCGNHITVGINKAHTSDVSISVFPNPASSHIQIQVPEIFRNHQINCVIRDYLGKAIQTEKISTGSIIEIPVLHLPSGIYLLELQSGNIHLHSKFVKVDR